MARLKHKTRTVCITGVAGFIGFHLAERLLAAGYRVVGIDVMNSYYDVRMKQARLKKLSAHSKFTFYKFSLADYKKLTAVMQKKKPDELVHLAAQAGVRYSIINPWAYADANYLGTLNVFEAARHTSLPRVLYASSSSVYGANKKQPFSEKDRVDTQLSIYAASKKANESLAYAYHHLFKMEMIGLRFFTVYGRWGRPDMALFIFTKKIFAGLPITLYNQGRMKRSFTHVSDIVQGIERLLEKPSKGAYALYNLGGSEAVPLTKFVSLIEKYAGKKATRVLKPLQPGDVPSTVADTSAAKKAFGYKAQTNIEEGIKDFVEWFKENESFLLSLEEPKQ